MAWKLNIIKCQVERAILFYFWVLCCANKSSFIIVIINLLGVLRLKKNWTGKACLKKVGQVAVQTKEAKISGLKSIYGLILLREIQYSST